MNHEKLVEQTLPQGVPLLMQGQTYPFNGDGYAAGEVLRLRDLYHIPCVIETGTCLGVTTRWFASRFDTVLSCELSEVFASHARSHLVGCDNVLVHVGGSPEFIAASEPLGTTLYFLDAHGISGKGETECPLLDELTNIAKHNTRPVIMIHDFQVPDRPDLGFDCFPDGNPFSLKIVAPYLDKIYGAGQWSHHFNSEAEGAKRGILYVEPA